MRDSIAYKKAFVRARCPERPFVIALPTREQIDNLIHNDGGSTREQIYTFYFDIFIMIDGGGARGGMKSRYNITDNVYFVYRLN